MISRQLQIYMTGTTSYSRGSFWGCGCSVSHQHAQAQPACVWSPSGLSAATSIEVHRRRARRHTSSPLLPSARWSLRSVLRVTDQSNPDLASFWESILAVSEKPGSSVHLDGEIVCEACVSVVAHDLLWWCVHAGSSCV